jgi:hypothetical protein
MGTPVTILYNFGEHQPEYLNAPCTLVKLEYLDDAGPKANTPPNNQRFYWAEFLKAEGGWDEIQHAINRANTYPLAAEQLAEASSKPSNTKAPPNRRGFLLFRLKKRAAFGGTSWAQG